MVHGLERNLLPAGMNAKALEDLAGAPRDDEQSRKRVAQEFAALLLFQVLKTMRATIPQGGLFEQDSLSNDVYSTLADMEVARAMAKKESMGLAKVVEKALESYHRSSKGPERESKGPPSENVSSPFGLRKDPVTGETRFHTGIDLALPNGSPISAVAPGKVIYSGMSKSYGNMVVLDHGHGIVTRYAHNLTNLVSVGDTVQAGQEIARVGSTGRSTGPHLHFEVMRRGTAVDPSPFLAKGAPVSADPDVRNNGKIEG